MEELMDDGLRDQLEQDACKETVRRGKAEKDAIDVIRRVTIL